MIAGLLEYRRALACDQALIYLAFSVQNNCVQSSKMKMSL